MIEGPQGGYRVWLALDGTDCAQPTTAWDPCAEDPNHELCGFG